MTGGPRPDGTNRRRSRLDRSRQGCRFPITGLRAGEQQVAVPMPSVPAGRQPRRCSRHRSTTAGPTPTDRPGTVGVASRTASPSPDEAGTAHRNRRPAAGHSGGRRVEPPPDRRPAPPPRSAVRRPRSRPTRATPSTNHDLETSCHHRHPARADRSGGSSDGRRGNRFSACGPARRPRRRPRRPPPGRGTRRRSGPGACPRPGRNATAYRSGCSASRWRRRRCRRDA